MDMNPRMIKAFFMDSVWGRYLFAAVFLFLAVSSSDCRKDGEQTVSPSEDGQVQTDRAEFSGSVPHRSRAQKSPDELVISTSPEDGRTVRDLNRALYVRFSRAVDPSLFASAVVPDPGGWRVSWAQENRMAILKHAQPFQKGTTYVWEIRLDMRQISLRFTALGPSSLKLIDAAEEQGVLDLDTAWTYRLQRLYEPEKLPASYQSSTPIRCGTTVWKRFKHIRSELKPETLNELKPYLVRPNHPESIYNRGSGNERSAGFRRSSSGSGLLYAQEKQQEDLDDEDLIERPENMFSYVEWRDKIRVWYRKGGKAKARRAVYWLEKKQMYDRFKELMGNEPLSDESACRPCDAIKSRRGRNLCRLDSCGGDGKLDIYLVPATEPGMYDAKTKESDHGWCREVDDGDTAAAFLLINRELEESPKNYFAAAIAHELFHAFQDAWDAWEDEWWVEGSAVWSEHFIGPEWNTEQEYLDDAFDAEKHILKTLTSDEDLHPYGIYLFPFHLSHEYGDEEIGRIWQVCGLEDTNALDAVKVEVGDFKQCFKDFVLHSTDLGKHDGYYPDSGGALVLWAHHTEEGNKITPEEKPILPYTVKLSPLSAKYYSFRNMCKPGSTPHIRFDLEDFIKDERVTVQAIIDPFGRAEDQDWSELEEKIFCINREDEKFDTINLVFASDYEYPDFEGELRIEMKALECDECYAYVTRTSDYEYQGRSSSTTENKEATIYMGFGPAVISGIASMSMDKQMILYPFKRLEVVEGGARYMHQTPERTERRTGRIVEAPMPDLPSVPVGGQMMAPVFLILYSDMKSGKVTYAMVPDPDVKIIWDDGREESFDIGKVSQKDVPVEGMEGDMPLDGVVASGDGEKQFAGGGEHEYTNRGRGSYEHSRDTYKWKIVRRKSPRKDN